jgi:hypothetical protein
LTKEAAKYYRFGNFTYKFNQIAFYFILLSGNYAYFDAQDNNCDDCKKKLIYLVFLFNIYNSFK